MLAYNKVYLMDVIEGLKCLPDKSVNLFIIDPPYFKVKGDFDFVLTWDEWLNLHERLAVECKRVMTENGTLFIWGDRKKIAYQQIIFDKFFKLESSIRWENTNQHKQQVRYSSELRCFPSMGEHLLMYSFDFEPGGWELTGWEKVLEEKIRPQHPFALYLKSEFERAGLSVAEVRRWVVSELNFDSAMINRWLEGSSIMKPEIYRKFREYLNAKGGNYLRREYEDLRREYEDLRRPFYNTRNLGDVFKYSNTETTDYNHPTIKPEGLTSDLIETCSRPGDLVCAPFAGSGTEVAMAAKLKRRWIGFDNVSKYVQMANDRANKIATKLDATRPIADTNDYSNLNTGLFAQQ